MDNTAVSLSLPLDPVALADVPRVSPETALRRLNGRHLRALLTSELGTGLDVISRDGAAVLTEDGADRVKLVSPFADGTDPAVHLRQVHDAKWVRGDRMAEILEQQGDQLSFLALAYPIGTGTHPWLMTVLDAVHGAIQRLEIKAKFILSVPRPADLSPVINPIIQTPAHSATPSGHATEAFGLAMAMEALIFGGPNQELRAIAARIADNRVVAGVHYPADGVEGRKLAEALAPIFSARMGLTHPSAGSSGAMTDDRRLAQTQRPPTGTGPLQTAVRLALAEIGQVADA